MNALLLKAAPWAIAIAVGGGFWISHNRAEQEKGRMAERLRIADSTLTVAVAAGARLAVRYDEDTATFRAELARWQAMKQRIRTVPMWDTLPPDTVPGPERIVVIDSTRPPTLDEILAAADTTIQRCSVALGTCEERVANLTERLRLTELRADAYRKLQPSGFQKAKSAAGHVALGVGLKMIYDAVTRR